MGTVLFLEGFLCMGAKARGRAAANSPLALQPTPKPSSLRRDLCIFSCGFCTAAILFCVWLLQLDVVQP